LGGLGSVGAESSCVGFLIAAGMVVLGCWCGVLSKDEACIVAVEVDFKGANSIGNYGNVLRKDGEGDADGRFGREGDNVFGVGRSEP